MIKVNEATPLNTVRSTLNGWLQDGRILKAADVHRIISNRLRDSRPVAWEEDISRNTLDTKPFDNRPAVGTLDASKFSNPKRDAVLEPLLDGRVLSDLIAKDTYPVPCAEDREGYLPGYDGQYWLCLLYTSPSPRDLSTSRMPSSA